MGSNSNTQHQNNQMNQTPGRPLRVLNFRKTASMDAIHTGSKGHVRSDPWIKDANLKQFQNGKVFLKLCTFISILKLVFSIINIAIRLMTSTITYSLFRN